MIKYSDSNNIKIKIDFKIKIFNNRNNRGLYFIKCRYK